MIKTLLYKHYIISIVILGYLVLFIPFLGQVHLFDWDEINFAEAAREMIVTGDWLNVQINYEPFWEKPPLFIWFQAISMSFFGINEFAARLPNVLTGLFTILLLYQTVRLRYGLKASILTVLFYLGSFTPHFYFKSGIIDPLFNLFIFSSVLFLVRAIENKTSWAFFISGLMLGFAVITKGPAAILLVGLTGLCYQWVYRINFYTFKEILNLVFGLVVIPGIFFSIQVSQNGWWFLKEFIIYQIELFKYPIASHGQPFYYHLVVLLFGCFPLFVLVLKALFTPIRTRMDSTYVRFMKVLFWVVLIVFSLVTTKIVHYSSMCYIPLSIIAGIWFSNHRHIHKSIKIILIVVGFCWFIIFSVLGILSIYPSLLTSVFINELIVDTSVTSMLRNSISWSYVPLLISIVFIISIWLLLLRYKSPRLMLFLILNSLCVSIFMTTTIPNIEHLVQGDWIRQLETYQNKPMVHFTYGFKSYAHRYYTQQNKLEQVVEVRQKMLNDQGIKSLYDFNQHEKKIFDNQVRDAVILNTEIPFSITARISKFEELEANYPNLIKVFEGNGYGVWERAKEFDK
jgi:hypothetical protein